MPRVFITQLCNVKNKGDQAILKSQISILKEICPDVKISVCTLWSEELLRKIEPHLPVYPPLIDLRVGKREFPTILSPFLFLLQFLLSMISLFFAKINLKPPYRPEVLNQFRHADLIVSSGHEPFTEGSLYQSKMSFNARSAYFFMLFWGAYDVFIAKKIFRKPFIIFPQSIGPLRTFIGRFLAKFILNNSDVILLRENYSTNMLEDLEIRTPVHVVSDTAFLFEGRKEFGRRLQKSSIGVSPLFCHGMSDSHKQQYTSALSRTLDFFITKYGVNIAFLPAQIGQGKAEAKEGILDDLDVSLMILEKMKNKDKTEIFDVETAEELKYLIAQLDLLVTTRMHPSILASVENIPFVAIVYEHKQIGLMDELRLKGITLNINDISFERLRSKVEFAWKNREKLKKQLASRNHILKQETKHKIREVVSRFLQRKPRHFIHIINVMGDNMGEAAILRSEIAEIEDMYKDVEISVSAERTEDLKRREPGLEVVDELVGNPVADADVIMGKRGKDRNSVTYKLCVLACSLAMFLRVFLCLASLMLMRVHVKPIYRSKVLKQIQKSDLVVFSGGEGIKEGSFFMPYKTYIGQKPVLSLYHKIFWWLFLFPKLCTVYFVRRILGKPIVLFPSSTGPFTTFVGRLMARTILKNLDVVLVREHKSSDILKDLRIPHVVTADIALLFDPQFQKPIRLPARPIVGLSPGLWDQSFPDDQKQRYVLAHSKVLDHLTRELGFTVICLPSCLPGMKHDDAEICSLIVRNMTDKSKVSYVKTKTCELANFSVDEFKYLLGQLDLLITTRMHPSIMACTNNVPFVTVIYDHKQTGFLEYLGLEDCSVEVNNVSYDNLLSRTEFVWSNREKIRKQLASRVRLLQNDVRAKIRQTVSKFVK